MVSTFVDPRTNPQPRIDGAPSRSTTDRDSLKELHALCREGRLYDIERWIIAGRPIQVAPESPPHRGRRLPTALEIALERGDQSLALLLLCNGYDPNREHGSPLDLALRARRWDLLDLLLAWGSNPCDVGLDDLFGTYQSSLFQRFMDLGVDLTAYHELASALAYHTGNKPLFGFAKGHRQTNPRIQQELNIALAHHAEEGNEKGVSLCLWAGADPHAPAASLRYSSPNDDEEDEEDRFLGYSAIHEACLHGRAKIVEQLGPDPSVDDFEDLFRWAGDSSVIEVLSRHTLPRDVGSVITAYIGWSRWEYGEWRSRDKLRALFRTGARWEDASPDQIANVRRALLKLSNQAFDDVMVLLSEPGHCSEKVRSDLARTPSMRRRMKEVGLFPAASYQEYQHRRHGPGTSRRILSRFGIELPKPPPRPLPRTVHIGTSRNHQRKLELSRPELFERVWAQSMVTLAREWGLSDRGLGKACRRLKIPVPPRGYWARKAAGKGVRRPPLPVLADGEAERVVIWLPD